MTDEELLAEIEATPAVAPKTTRGEAFGRGAAQGATLGWGDELAGAARATKALKPPQDVRTPGPKALAKAYPGVPYPEAAQRWFAENRPDQQVAADAEAARVAQQGVYRGERDAVRARNETASKDQPGWFLGGEVIGMVPGMLLSGGNPAAVAGQGALQGAGFSDSDTGTGLLGDAALGGAGGLAGYGAGKALGYGLGKVAGYAGRKVGEAGQKAEELAVKAKTGELKKLQSSYGGLRQTENKAIREAVAMEAAGTISPENAALLAKARESGRFGEALNEALANDLEFLTGRTGEVSAAKAAMQAAQENLPKAIAEEKARVLSGGMAKDQIKARLKRYGPMGVAGAVAGHVVGGPFGALLGGASGAAVRPMVHAVRRAATHPAVQTRLWNPVERAATAAMSPVPARAGTGLLRAAGVAYAPSLEEYVTGRRAESEAAAELELERLLAEEN